MKLIRETIVHINIPIAMETVRLMRLGVVTPDFTRSWFLGCVLTIHLFFHLRMK